MFKFGFLKGDVVEEKNVDTGKSTITWTPASKVEVSESQTEKEYNRTDYARTVIFPGFELDLIRSERALIDLKQENCKDILEAESQHSDLVPAKYEGGLKIWECSYDLGLYISDSDIDFKDKMVLDLGCGAGVIGLIALCKNSFVHFQDYNVEVIKTVTIPNVLINTMDRKSTLERCEFFCGDWESFTRLNVSNDEAGKYDLIFTSETIYNPDNHRKLYEVFKQRLKPGGIGFVAGKTYYFGVGGGMRQFQGLIEEDGFFHVKTAWKSQNGLQREILIITRKQRS